MDQTWTTARPAIARPRLPSLLEIGGAALLVAGPLLPWLTLYAGNVELRGIDGVLGLLLGGLGIGALLFAVVPLLGGGRLGRPARLLRNVLAIGALALCGYLLVELVLTMRQLSAEPLLLAGYGPGLFVATTGAVLLVLAPALPRADLASFVGGRASSTLARAAGVAGLLVAGVLHLALAPGHFALLPLLGAGFLATGVAQAALAIALVGAPGRRVLQAGIGATAIPLLLYAVDVTAGLPLVGHEAAHAALAEHSHAVGQVHAAGPDAIALVTKSAELLALVSVWRIRARTKQVDTSER